MKQDKVDSTCQAYAQDTARNEGRAVKVTLTKNFDAWCEWTSDVWDDGVPVTKMFHRNKEIKLHVPAGTVLHGVVYRSYADWSMYVFDFVYGDTWYQTFVGREDSDDVSKFHGDDIVPM